MATRCILKCNGDICKPITMVNNVPAIFGRSRDTRIKEKKCSKRQLELTADFEKYKVAVKQLGANSSYFQGKPLLINQSVILTHGQSFEVLKGQYEYTVLFEPPPPSTATVTQHEKAADAVKVLPGKHKSTLDTFVQYKRQKFSSMWQSIDNGDLFVYGADEVEPSSLIAAYDVDGTIVTTQSGKVFPVNKDDWKILFLEIPGKLNALQKDGYKVVFITNQAGIGTGKQTPDDVKSKFENIVQKLGIPVQIFISPGKSKYRKPLPGIWDYMVKYCNGNIEVNMTESFFVGDAAGRPSHDKRKKKDHSCSDRLFALNLELQFFTPEEHFLGSPKELFSLPSFDPRLVNPSLPIFEPASTKVPNHKAEVAVLVGYPGSGKSFVANHIFAPLGYVIANRDMLGSWQKCTALMEKALQKGQHIVVDNTNGDVESRERYIKVASKFSVPIRCFLMKTSKDHSRHNNKFRELYGDEHSKINEMIYNMYKSKYQEPSLGEGFEEIVLVNFVPKFDSKKMESLYKMFLLEK